MEDKNYLTEAFKAFNVLNEDVFDISVKDGFEDAKEFVEEPVEEMEVIYDPLASDEEELEDTYVGKAILRCEICQSMLYKDPSEVVIDEESKLANVEETCPYCQSEEGFKVIGQVAEFCEKCAEKEECEEHCEESEHEEEKVEKSEVEENIEESVDLKEADKPAAISLEDAQKWVDYDMKKYGKISDRTNRLVKKAGFQILKDDHGDYEVAAGKFESCEESLREDFEKVEIETDKEKMTMESEENGKVVVTTEPKEEVHEEERAEVIEPVTDEVKAEFKTEDELEKEKEDEFQDIEIDEFDEEEFDTLGEQYLKRVYENVESFKTTNGSVKGNNLKLEGLITFKSGKQAKTNFVFEAKTVTKTGKLKFIGENKQFAKGKKSFTLTGKMDGNKLITESFTYNYVARDAQGKAKRLYGTVNK